jgi:hypothetical protein
MGRRRGLSKSERKWQQKCVSSGPIPWVFDMANGMSNRRSTLKRPIVCRSKKDGNCGVVQMFFQFLPAVSLPGADVIAEIEIVATKLPEDSNYELIMAGPYFLVGGPFQVTIGQLYQLPAKAPLQSGFYTTNLVALNSQGCRVDAQADSVVV